MWVPGVPTFQHIASAHLFNFMLRARTKNVADRSMLGGGSNDPLVEVYINIFFFFYIYIINYCLFMFHFVLYLVFIMYLPCTGLSLFIS